ncbi:secretion system protein E, partial [Halorubrum sp. AD140]|nr:secretion system protein E [Halorubrum sp. AD140]
NVQDVFQWQAETDEFLQMGDSNTLEDIMFDRGWSRATLDAELRKRRVVLAYLIDRGLNSYAQVAATFQAFINDPETVLALMANEQLERSLEDLREMESVLINVDREKEAMVPRPDPDAAGREEVERILEDAEDLFAEYHGRLPDSVADALLDVVPAPDVEATPDADHETLAETAREAAALHPQATGPERLETDARGEAATDDGPTGETADVPSTDEFDGVADASPIDRGPGVVASDRTPIEAERASGNGSEVTADGPEVDVGGPEDDADGDRGNGSGAIDFDEPFDEGVDVFGPAAEAETAEGPPGEDTEAADTTPDEAERDEAESDEVESAFGEVVEGGDGDGDEGDDGDGEGEGESEGAAESEREDDEATDDDIDEWGFGAVESPEDR